MKKDVKTYALYDNVLVILHLYFRIMQVRGMTQDRTGVTVRTVLTMDKSYIGITSTATQL